ncbi:hypothetical protein ACWGPW_28955 [Paenibacillus chitinolyticus]
MRCVTFTIYQPFDEQNGLSKSKEELETHGILVAALPEREHNGKSSVLYINPQTKALWYEYVDVNPPEDRITKLEIATEENKKANLDTQEAVLQLYEMVTGPQA